MELASYIVRADDTNFPTATRPISIHLKPHFFRLFLYILNTIICNLILSIIFAIDEF
jgi:hypothetical protein